ncbi:MAG TPA: CNP1-like family protein [Paucimonas sp.]|nr:CNP1-like family protein [Paucimonas sp.]
MIFPMQVNHFAAATCLPRWGAACMLAAAAASVFAQSKFEEDFDNRDKPWQEIAIQLPASPVDENLLSFQVSPTATQDFAVDAKSLSVGSDGVVRYTLVAKSRSGAKNISYEGIRCRTKEKKLYAFGHLDGTWGRSRRDEWEPLSGTRPSPQQAALAADYFCRDGMVAGTAADIVARIRRQQRLWANNIND